MFEIKCEPLTPGRRTLLAPHEVAVVGRPLRLVFAAGGAYIFYYGTRLDVPETVQSIANVFVVVGIAAVLLAIFSQKLVEMRYFSKALKSGCFPDSVSVDEGGMTVRRKNTGRISAERLYPFTEIGRIEEHETYFKISLPHAATPGIFIFKEDFELGEPEAFQSFIASKKNAHHLRSK